MAYQGWFSLGGTEIANSARTTAYASQVVPLLELTDCWGCTDLAEMLGHDPYETPMLDRPDWFSQNDPDSWDFCGFYPLEIEGLDDGVRTAEVTQLSTDGGVVGAPRYNSREIRVSGLLIGATDAAVTYGMNWLSKALEGAPCRSGADGCTGDHLCYYSACPPMCTNSPALDGWPIEGAPQVPHQHGPFYLCDGGLIESAARACSVNYERTLYEVTCTSGPTITERYNLSCASMVKVEFILVAGVPWAFSAAISALPGDQVPTPIIAPQTSCDPGTDVLVRTNLATNPIPVGNAATSTGGWRAFGSGFTATADTGVGRTSGSSVRLDRTVVTPNDNLAPNPDPAGSLDGWSWLLGQSSTGGAERTNLIENPWPRAAGDTADGWVYDVPAGGPGTITRTNEALNPQAVGPASGNSIPRFAGWATGAEETGLTSAVVDPTDTPVEGITSFARRQIITPKASGSGGWQATASSYRIAYEGTVDDRVTVSVWVRISDAPEDSQRRVVLRVAGYVSGSSSAVNLSDSPPVIAVEGQWTRLSVTYVPTGDFDQIGWWVYQTSGYTLPALATFDITGLLIEEGIGVGSYFDGNTATTDEHAYKWAGQENASASIEQALDSPGFNAPLDLLTGPGPDGEAGYAGHTQGVADDQAWTITYTSEQVVPAGETYTASVYVRSTSERTVQFAGRDWALPGYGWSRVSGQFVSDGNPVVLTVAGTGQATGEEVGVARALVEQAPTLGAYFDGSTPESGGYRYAWSGTADASTSIATLAPAEATTELVTTGDGPDGQDTFQRTTIVVPKVGGESGPRYEMDVPTTTDRAVTVDMQVRSSVRLTVALQVAALDAQGLQMTQALGDPVVVPIDEWTHTGPVTVIVPAGAARLRITTLIPSDTRPQAGETIDAAAVRVVEGVHLNDPQIGALQYVGQHDGSTTTIDVVGGGAYSASVYMAADVVARGWIRLDFYNGTSLVGRTAGPEVLIPASGTENTQWQRATISVLAPEDATSVVVLGFVNSILDADVGDSAWMTETLVEASEAVLGYFDGSTPDTDTMTYEWSGTANASTSNALLAIPDTPGPIVDPDCPPIPDPPRPPLIDLSCTDEPTTWRRYVVDVSEDLVPIWQDAVAVLRFQTGASAVRQLRVRFYPNPLGSPLAALNPCEFCGELAISYIPPNSQMTVDGVRKWVTVTNLATGAEQSANQLLTGSDGGPAAWPLLGCGTAYTLVIDISPTTVLDMVPQICLAARI